LENVRRTIGPNSGVITRIAPFGCSSASAASRVAGPSGANLNVQCMSTRLPLIENTSRCGRSHSSSLICIDPMPLLLMSSRVGIPGSSGESGRVLPIAW
jgi:hypothetical protein